MANTRKVKGPKLTPEQLRRKLDLRQGSRTRRVSTKRDIRFDANARAAAQRGRSAFSGGRTLDVGS